MAVGPYHADGYIVDDFAVGVMPVLSDVTLSRAIVDNLPAFVAQVNLDRPAGYSEFRPYQVGDYDYRKAIYRVRMRTVGMLDKIAVSSLKLQVDVPDVHDRGTIVIAQSEIAGKRVNFSRKYHQPPEVVAALKGGAVFGVAQVLSVDRTGFTVVLKSAANVGIAGTVTWQSQGF
jgi:hypothetical protein